MSFPQGRDLLAREVGTRLFRRFLSWVRVVPGVFSATQLAASAIEDVFSGVSELYALFEPGSQVAMGGILVARMHQYLLCDPGLKPKHPTLVTHSNVLHFCKLLLQHH